METKKKSFKNRNIFAYLDNILRLKDMETYARHVSDGGFDSDFKKVVLVRYLSMSNDPRVREVVFRNQLLFDRTDCKTLYRYLICAIPKQESSFIRYLK